MAISIKSSTTTLKEVAANNGAIANTITFTATGGKFAGDNGAVLGSVEGTPKGLQAVLVKTSATTAKLSFTGAAEAHGSGNGNVVKQDTTTDNVAVTAQVDTITLSGAYAAGDKITVSGVATDPVEYIVLADDVKSDAAANAEAIAAKLVEAINAAADTTVTAEATANGELTLTATTAGTPFTAAATATSTSGTIAGETTTANVAAAVAQVNTITLSGTYAEGDKITVSGVATGAVEYIVLADDVKSDAAANAEAIAAKLVAAINDAADTTVTAEATANGVLTLTATTAGTPFTAAVTSTNPADPIPGPTVTFFAKDFVTVDDNFPGEGVVLNDITFAFNNPAAAKTLALVAPTGAGTSETYNKTTLPEITGTAPDGVTKVYIYNNGGTKPVGEATVTDNGWKFKLPTDKLKDGAYNLTASTAADGKGAMTAGFAFTVDTKAPSAPSVTAIKGAISDVTPVLTGKAEKFAKVEVFADGDTQAKSLGVTFANAKGVWTLQVEDPALLGADDATYKITAKAIDAAGNETKSKKAVDLTIDTKIDTPTLVATAPKKNTVALNGEVKGETGGTLQLYGGEDGSVPLGKVIKIAKGGIWKTSIKLTEGKHLLSVVATDAAGNVSDNSEIKEVTIDTFTATPTVELVKTGDVLTGLKGTAEAGATVTIKLGSKALTETPKADANGNWVLETVELPTVTKDTLVKITATAKDTANNVSKASTAVEYTVKPPVKDDKAPTYDSAAISDGNTVVTLTFNEDVVSNVANATALKAAVKFSADGTDFADLAADDKVAIVEGKLVVTFAAALTGDTNKIKVATKALKDAAGNVLDTEVNTAPVPAVAAGATEGNDTLTGTTGADNINGLAGKDTINGGDGDDVIDGGDGDDVIDGGDGDDTITGGAGDDTITGGAGADSISGGDGNDTINDFAGSDTVDGGADTDTLALSADSAELAIATDAQLVNVEKITVGSAVTTLALTNQTENFEITAATAAGDVLTGGKGADTFIVTTTGATGVTINGGDGADIIGLTSDNTGASSVITGGAGIDVITLTAGDTGSDVVVVGTAQADADVVKNFVSGKDDIKFSGVLKNEDVTTLVDAGDISSAVTIDAAIAIKADATQYVFTNAAFDIDTALLAHIAAPTATTAAAVVTAAMTALNATAKTNLDATFTAAETVLFVLDGTAGTSSAVFSFTNSTATDNTIDAGELVLVGVTDVLLATGDITL